MSQTQQEIDQSTKWLPSATDESFWFRLSPEGIYETWPRSLGPCVITGKES